MAEGFESVGGGVERSGHDTNISRGGVQQSNIMNGYEMSVQRDRGGGIVEVEMV